MLMAMATDFRVIIIKFADRLHNMRTLGHLPAARQKDMARETMEIYAPLAHRLGIFKFKWELEDLAFRYLHPRDYYNLVAELRQRRAEREEIIAQIIGFLGKSFEEAGIKAEITGRPKHLCSIWRKMTQQNKELSESMTSPPFGWWWIPSGTAIPCWAKCTTCASPFPGALRTISPCPRQRLPILHTTVVALKGHP